LSLNNRSIPYFYCVLCLICPKSLLYKLLSAEGIC
jgi:hypothetical protein